MKKLYFLLLLTLFFPGILQAETESSDSLVKVNELKFHSPQEKEAFLKFLHDQTPNYFDLLIAINGEAALKNKAARIFNEQKETSKAIFNKNKSAVKGVKAVYKNLHSSLLKKYELQNYFTDIFRNGHYNCVSATALFAMVFEELGVPYHIKESPIHVYLIAYPESHRILVETTSPTAGYLVFDHKFKSNFVQSLKDNKMISEQEFSTSGTDVLFDKYYFKEENINLKELVGIQYLNDAFYAFEKENYKYAFEQMEKAYLLYPSEKVSYHLLIGAAIILDKCDYKELDDLNYLVKISRHGNDQAKKEIIINEFLKINQKHHLNNSKSGHFDKAYNYLMEHIEGNEEIKKEISFLFNYEKGRVLYNQANFNNSLKHIRDAYNLKPENVEVESLFINVLLQTMRYFTDGSALVKKIEEYASEFPALKENELFQIAQLNSYLYYIGQLYEAGKKSEAEKYRSLFESRLTNNPEIGFDPNLVGRAYSLGASYYFKNNDMTKVKNLLNKGLQYAPDNMELRTRLHMISQR